MKHPIALLLIASAAAQQSGSSQPSWKLVYFHDEDKASLSIHHLSAISAKCAVALGVLSSHGRPKPVDLVSTDGGATWSMAPLKESGLSVHLVTEKLAFMVTAEGVWRSGDCGRNWEKVSKQKDLVHAYFLDESRGFAVGTGKKALMTRDGGQTWQKLKITDEPKSDAERSAYVSIDFADNKFGLIVGVSIPRRLAEAGDLPAWVDPESAERLRQWPSLTLLLQTTDGGETWLGSTSSLLGRITRARTVTDKLLMTLVEFDYAFEWPSEVYRVDLAGLKTTRVFRDKSLAITDLASAREGRVYLGGYELPGKIPQLPIPGKVRILQGDGSDKWEPMKVDYRAVAKRVQLATPKGAPPLAATDTGMILQLRP